jgi:hypothetical protein
MEAPRKVAVAGVGHSPVDRRWDGASMDKTLGAYSILACQKAMDEAGAAPGLHGGTVDRPEETLLLHSEKQHSVASATAITWLGFPCSPAG